jgi:hypothetical protein
MSEDDISKAHFNRNYTEETIDGKVVAKYISSPFTDAVYYSFTTLSTIGYGDITPKTTLAKSWTSFMQAIVIIMTMKLFEYIYNPNSTTIQALLTNIQLVSAQNSQLQTEKNELESEIKELKLNGPPKSRWGKALSFANRTAQNNRVVATNNS